MEIYTEKNIRCFYKFVVVNGPDDCWEWVGGTATGYGLFNFNSHQIKASRFAFWIATGIYPGELKVCHSCDNRMCVNPKHLFLGTDKDNIQDAVRKGRMVHGSKHYLAKLTAEAVHEIRMKWLAGTASRRQLAVEYGVGIGCIWSVVHRETWKHVK